MSTETIQNKKNEVVRIVLDGELLKTVNLIQEEYPLLSNVEAVKLILSRGIKKDLKLRKILENLKKSNPIKKDLSEEEMFSEWEDFNTSF